MAISHVCLSCGLDLARIRAAREPHYGLMLVRCPGCATASVRRRHPLVELWRSFRRFDWSVTVMAVNAALFGGLAAGMLGGLLYVLKESADLPFVELWRRHWFGLGFSLTVWPLAAGTWLTVGLGHWRRLAAWITFGSIVAAGVAVAGVVIAVDDLEAVFRETGAWPSLADLAVGAGDTVLRGWTLLFLMMLGAVAGVPPGLAIRWLLVRGRWAVWRWRRRRQRRERQT